MVAPEETAGQSLLPMTSPPAHGLWPVARFSQLDGALAQCPHSVAALILQAHLHIASGEYDAAALRLRTATLLTHDNAPLLHQLLAKVSEHSRDYGGAYEHLQAELPFRYAPGTPAAQEGARALTVRMRLPERVGSPVCLEMRHENQQHKHPHAQSYT